MIPITPDLLTPIFAKHLGGDPIVTGVQRGPVGNGQEVWFVDVVHPTRQLVLRRTSPQGPLDWTDREREFNTLVAVAGTDLPIPHGHWSEPAGNQLGNAYFVMERLRGDPVRRVPRSVAATVASDVGRLLAKLHRAAIDAPRLGHDDPGDSAAATKAELDAWTGRYRKDRPVQLPFLGVLLAHLERTVSGQNEPSVLLWGDAGPHNLLHESGVVTAMLDWELSHLGDPHEDLGSLAWSYGGSDLFEIAFAAYETESGQSMDRDRIRYFEVMACATRSIMLLNAVSRYISGTSDAPNLAGLGLHLIPDNLERAGILLGWETAETPNLRARDPDPDRIRPDGQDMLAGTIRFLRDRVLPATEDKTLRRGLRTTEALLATAALHIAVAPDSNNRRRRDKEALLATLVAAGVDTRRGLETAAILVESDPAFASIRTTVREYLMVDVAVMGALAGPLNDLYGD